MKPKRNALLLNRNRSAERLQWRVGRVEIVLIDEVVEEGAVARSKADTPEIDGQNSMVQCICK